MCISATVCTCCTELKCHASLQLMVTGVHGSLGDSAPSPVEAGKGLASDSATIRLPPTVAGSVQEIPLCYPGVTPRRAQVKPLRKQTVFAVIK